MTKGTVNPNTVPAGAVTSLYLDNDSKAKLDALAQASGLSRSLVVRNLLQKAGSDNKITARKLLTELSEMLDAT